MSILLWILGLTVLSLIKGAGIEKDLQANASYIAELSASSDLIMVNCSQHILSRLDLILMDI